MKQKIHKLESAKLSEDQIVIILGITHKEYRTLTTTVPTIQLTNNARQEIMNEQTDEPVALLVKQYKTTTNEIKKARAYTLKFRPVPSDNEVMDWYQNSSDDTITLASASRKFGISLANVKPILERLGIIDRTLSREADIVRLLKQKTIPYITIAETLNCSISLVSQYAKKHSLTRHVQASTHNWPQILAEVEDGINITTIAKKHNISRSSIYYQLRTRCQNES